MTPYRKLDASTLRRLSVRHHVDPRSILREQKRPGSVRGMAGERARAALREALAEADMNDVFLAEADET